MPQYISVSRRTDIPRFYADHFFAAWQKGSITYDSGYGRSCTVSLRQEDVLGYIFWSKDFRRFLANPLFSRLLSRNNAVFHYTINDCPELEPGIPPLAERLASLAGLVDLVGAERIIWRYDPLCKYSLKNGRVKDNVEPFFGMLAKMRRHGIRRCHFSFATLYAKLSKRTAVRFIPFASAEQQKLAAAMVRAARAHAIEPFVCSDQELAAAIPGLQAARCVDQELLAVTDRFGVHRPLAEKPTRKGCGCHASRDIGAYSQPCGHGCLYCYANPA